MTSSSDSIVAVLSERLEALQQENAALIASKANNSDSYTNSSGKTCRWAIISTAQIADKVFPALQTASNSKVVAIASRSKERAEGWAKSHGLDAGAACTYDEVLQRDDVDAVYVPLPSGLRNEFILKAAKAGKAVYAEKPFGGSVADIEEVLSACKASNVQFMDGTMWVHSNRTLEIEKSLQAKEIGNVQRVVAAFTFHGPDEKDSEGREWLHGGNGRTDKTREPMGCFGDQGWYPVSAILLAYNFELPVKVMMAHTKMNKVDTIIGGVGVIWFAGDRMATLDFGADSTHRSQVEIVGETGSIRIDDLVGGQGRTGDFMAYFQPFVGSSSFVKADVMGKDETVDVEPCDHVIRLVSDFVRCVVNEKVDDRWPARTIACHKVMCALFESAQKGGAVVEL